MINENLKTLCNLIGRVAGREIKTSKDFEYLSQKIFEKTNMLVSVSTLKRIFGYVNNVGVARENTLDILCQFVGYKDWGTFVANGDDSTRIESNPLMATRLDAMDMYEDERITVLWRPNRRCVFRYLGDCHFVVEESVNSKLSAGDTFVCRLFIEDEPLYLEDLVMGGKENLTYVCGRIDGIRFIKENPSIV